MINKHKPIGKRKWLSSKYTLNLKKKVLLGIVGVLILNWMKKQPICGQDIMDKILKEFNIYIGPGTLYPILYNFQKNGIIEPKLYSKKKIYFLTKKGEIVSQKAQNDYFKIQKSITNFLR